VDVEAAQQLLELIIAHRAGAITVHVTEDLHATLLLEPSDKNATQTWRQQCVSSQAYLPQILPGLTDAFAHEHLRVGVDVVGAVLGGHDERGVVHAVLAHDELAEPLVADVLLPCKPDGRTCQHRSLFGNLLD